MRNRLVNGGIKTLSFPAEAGADNDSEKLPHWLMHYKNS